MPSFWLEYDNDGQTQEFSFEGDSVSVGRDKSSDFVLDHPTVSRQHAVVTSKNGSFYLVVLSRGGMTAIDGQQVQGEVMLYDRSMIHLGQLQFRFRSDYAAQKPVGGQQQMGQNSFGGMQGGPQNQPAGQTGGFAPSFGGAGGQDGQTGGFSQPFEPGGGQSGQTGGFSQPFGPGGGQNTGSANTGSFGAGNAQAPAGGQQGGGQQGAGQQVGDQQVGEVQGSGIVSWDEIASSSEAGGGNNQPSDPSIHERMQQGKKKDQQTNPLLVVVAGAAIVGLLWFTFLGGDPGKDGPDDASKPLEEQAPMSLEVSCMGESACLQAARDAYKIGLEKLEKKGAEVSNLFEGYKKLLETEKYLEKAGKSEPLPSMAELVAKKQQARQELTDIFKNERVKYHQAKKRNLHRPMAQTLDAVKVYFPDPTAREHRWALHQEIDMKKKGIYPKHVYPPR